MILMIVLGEVSGELMNAAEVELPASENAKNAGKTVGRATCSDAPGGNRFRDVTAFRTTPKPRGERALYLRSEKRTQAFVRSVE